MPRSRLKDHRLPNYYDFFYANRQIVCWTNGYQRFLYSPKHVLDSEHSGITESIVTQVHNKV